MDQLTTAEQPPLYYYNGEGDRSLHLWKLYAPLSTRVMPIMLTHHRQPTEQKEKNSGRRDSYVTLVWGIQASSFLVHGVRVLPERQAASSISFLIYFKGISPIGG